MLIEIINLVFLFVILMVSVNGFLNSIFLNLLFIKIIFFCYVLFMNVFKISLFGGFGLKWNKMLWFVFGGFG